MRLSLLYSPDHKEIVINSFGRADKVALLRDDCTANEEWTNLVLVRIPRRFVYDRFRNTLLEEREGGFYPCGSNSPYRPSNCDR